MFSSKNLFKWFSVEHHTSCHYFFFFRKNRLLAITCSWIYSIWFDNSSNHCLDHWNHLKGNRTKYFQSKLTRLINTLFLPKFPLKLTAMIICFFFLFYEFLFAVFLIRNIFVTKSVTTKKFQIPCYAISMRVFCKPHSNYRILVSIKLILWRWRFMRTNRI